MSSYLQTPFTTPKHRRGVHWEKNIPDSCRRDADTQDVDRARKDFTRNLVRQLAEENKVASTAHWLADGVVTLECQVGRQYDISASERFQSESKKEPPSMNLNVFPSMGGIDYLDLTLHDIPHRQPLLTQQTENLLRQSASCVNVNQRETYSQLHERSSNDTSVHHSIHKPINAELVDSVNRETLFMHNNEYMSDQMDLDIKDVPDPLDLQPMPTLTSDDPYLHLPGPSPDESIDATVTMNFLPPHHTTRPRSRLDRLARIALGSGGEESEESSSEGSTPSTEGYPIPVHPISGGGEWTMLSEFFAPHFPHSPSGDKSPSTHPPSHAARCTPSTSQPKTKVKSVRVANLIPGHSFVVRERRFGKVPKEGAKEPLLWSSQQPNTEKPRTASLLPAQYHLNEDMPVVLPRVPYAITRARRLLLASHESQPVAWVSMIGDTQWVDPEGRFWKRDWSTCANKDDDFVVGDVCRQDDETIIQAHLKGSYQFSVVTEHGGDTRPTRRNLVPVPETDQPKVTSIAAVTPTTFITGGHDRLIQLWSFGREGQRPVIAKSERLSAGHTSAIRTIAMGRDNVLWSAAGSSLLGTDIRYWRTVVPLTRKANYIINQMHFNQGELLLETSDLDHPFRLYDPRTSLDQHTSLFGVSQRATPSSFQRGGWINRIFAHGWTTQDKKEYVVLWDLRNTKKPLQTMKLPCHTGTHCAFYKEGRHLIVTGNRHISFFTI